MAVAEEHTTTIAFINIGLMESAFRGQRVDKHMRAITAQVKELFRQHKVHILCFVEAGEPRVGLSPAAKKLFEKAVRAGAADNTCGNLTFFWADQQEAMLTVHVAGIHMQKGDIITWNNLDPNQSWRNAMPFYIQGPTNQDRIMLLLSHQPSSAKHNLTMQTKNKIVRNLMCAGLKQDGWPDRAAGRSLFIIGGDLNMSAHALKVTAQKYTDEELQVATPKADKRHCKSGDVAIGHKLRFLHTQCLVKNRDPQHGIVLVKFPWPSTTPPDIGAETSRLQGVWHPHSLRMRASSSSSPVDPSNEQSRSTRGRKRQIPEDARSYWQGPLSPMNEEAEREPTPAAAVRRHEQPAGTAVQLVDFSDDVTDEPEEQLAAPVSDDAAWEDAFTLMMLLERVLGKRPGTVNCFDAPEEPQMTLTSAQREVVALVCQQLLFGFASRGAGETPNTSILTKDLGTVIQNMQRALDRRRDRGHDDRDHLSIEAS